MLDKQKQEDGKKNGMTKKNDERRIMERKKKDKKEGNRMDR